MISQSKVDKREKILEVALELFVNQGFHATPTSLIANKAGVANGTLFHYFNTKEELINTLYLEIKDRFFNQVTLNYDSALAFKERIKKLWENAISWANEYPDSFRFLQQFSNSPFLTHLKQEQISRHLHFFYDYIEEGISKGIFKRLPVDLMFQMSLFQMYGLIYYLFDHPETIQEKEVLNAAFNCYWHSLCTT